ncbi:MAG: FUSC family protein [Burkholderiaceae bacterium]|nr:FUSC family protein [Microbacteriaceae bacterium]
MAGPSANAIRRLERSLRRRIEITQRMRRVATSVPAAIQITIAATASYAIAHYLLGHQFPVVAVTVTITALGFARDARPRRVLDILVGILIGISLSEVLLFLIGSGPWQLALVLGVTLLIARFISPSPAFAVAAGVQSMLVMLLPAPEGGVFVRSLDGLVAGVVALVVTALIPRDPRRAAARDAKRLFSTIDEALGTLQLALETADEPAADLALTRLRRTQQLVDDWTSSLESAIGIAKISPFLRRHLPELRAQARLLGCLDLASRHLRIITRRVDFLVRDGAARPELAAVVGRISAGIRCLANDQSLARVELAAVAGDLDPAVLLPGADVTEAVLVLLMRPLVVDLMVATGTPVDEARALLPEV